MSRYEYIDVAYNSQTMAARGADGWRFVTLLPPKKPGDHPFVLLERVRDEGLRAAIIREVESEMDRTDDNATEPATFLDYTVDVIRHLLHQLPEDDPLRIRVGE